VLDAGVTRLAKKSSTNTCTICTLALDLVVEKVDTAMVELVMVVADMVTVLALRNRAWRAGLWSWVPWRIRVRTHRDTDEEGMDVVNVERRVVDAVGMEGKVLKVWDVVDADTVGTERKVVVVVVTAVGMGEDMEKVTEKKDMRGSGYGASSSRCNCFPSALYSNLYANFEYHFLNHAQAYGWSPLCDLSILNQSHFDVISCPYIGSLPLFSPDAD
jgi:hypothetical protein